MKNRIVYNGEIYTELDNKIISVDGRFYVRSKDLINIGGKRYYRPLKLFDVVDNKKVREIS